MLNGDGEVLAVSTDLEDFQTWLSDKFSFKAFLDSDQDRQEFNSILKGPVGMSCLLRTEPQYFLWLEKVSKSTTSAEAKLGNVYKNSPMLLYPSELDGLLMDLDDGCSSISTDSHAHDTFDEMSFEDVFESFGDDADYSSVFSEISETLSEFEDEYD